MSRHGTLYRYQQGCICQPCTAANAAYHREWKARQRIIPPWLLHGSVSTYSNYGCRCRPCVNAHSAYMAEYKAADKQRRRREKAAR